MYTKIDRHLQGWAFFRSNVTHAKRFSWVQVDLFFIPNIFPFRPCNGAQLTSTLHARAVPLHTLFTVQRLDNRSFRYRLTGIGEFRARFSCMEICVRMQTENGWVASWEVTSIVTLIPFFIML